LNTFEDFQFKILPTSITRISPQNKLIMKDSKIPRAPKVQCYKAKL